MTVEEILLHYNITEDIEDKAVRIAYMFYTCVRETFPDKHMLRFPFKNDPRNSLLFKYAYKFLNDTQDKLPKEDYEIYVKAQVLVIKHVHEALGTEPFIQPCHIAGEKSWKRYLVYKRHHMLTIQLRTAKDAGINIHDLEFIKNELLTTKKVLEKKLGELTKEKLLKKVHSTKTCPCTLTALHRM
jgi:hypothetical protein